MTHPICTAISLRAVVRFRYSSILRVAEPYCHGFSTAGHEVLRAYQVEGESASGEALGWRLFSLDEVSDLEVLQQHFITNRPGYTPTDAAMAEVHCHV